jgi:hypothetical protein
MERGGSDETTDEERELPRHSLSDPRAAPVRRNAFKNGLIAGWQPLLVEGARRVGHDLIWTIRSWSNTLSSVLQATQRNAGRKTAGVDGEVALTPQARAELAVHVHREARSWRPRPIKRVYISKAGNRAKLRPLGIPVIADRCHQSASRRRAA